MKEPTCNLAEQKLNYWDVVLLWLVGYGGSFFPVRSRFLVGKPAFHPPLFSWSDHQPQTNTQSLLGVVNNSGMWVN